MNPSVRHTKRDASCTTNFTGFGFVFTTRSMSVRRLEMKDVEDIQG